MAIKKLLFLSIILLLSACSEKEVVLESKNLQEYINANNTKKLDEVIACAASKNGETAISYIFYYPITGATNIKYFEAEVGLVNKNDFTLYRQIELEVEPVFNGYLERFVRNNATESLCIVTYETEGKIHVSNPIRLKNETKPTEWTNEVTIDTTDTIMPKFIWNDGSVAENAIYFQVITNENNDFLSGTYTFEKNFQFYNLDNVVLNITEETNPTLNKNETYNFTMMGVSEDNWVNLVIQNSFVAK